MEIEFKTQQQVALANLLWKCQTQAEAQEVLRFYGREAEVVYMMMVAEAFDAVDDLDQARDCLAQFQKPMG